MRAIILAAGEGTRLRPQTLTRPKCMVELAGRPLIQYQLDALEESGVSDISLVTGYRHEMLEALGLPTRHNPAYDRTNMVASLMCAADLLDGSDDVLVCYSDIVYERRVLEPLLACRRPVGISIDLDWRQLWELRFEDPFDDAETLILDGGGDVVELGRKPDSLDQVQGQYMGLIRVAAEAAPEWVALHQSMDPAGNYDGRNLANLFMTSFLQHWIDQGHSVRAVPVHGGWLEVDSATDLERYQRLHDAGELARFWRTEPAPC